MRTLDAGADKPLPFLRQEPEDNPFLGRRGIRLSLAEPELLRTQLRAILRVAAEHPLKVMFPMVATLEELRAARAAARRGARRARQPRRARGRRDGRGARRSRCRRREFAPEVDFFSIGTNDLAQYTMAAERGNAALAGLLDGRAAPRCSRLIAAVTAAAEAHGRWVGVCGELAGDPEAAVLLAGLGVRELSMAASRIPAVKAALREVDSGGSRAAAAGARRPARRSRRAVASRAPRGDPDRDLGRTALRPLRRRRHRHADRAHPGRHGAGAARRRRRRDRRRRHRARVLFCVAAATDWVDGRLARRWDVTTKLGSFLDTTADKLLVSGVLIALLAAERASPWIVALIIGRELVLMGLRGVIASEGEVMAPSMLGKLKTSIQFLAIALAIVRPGDPVGGLYIDEWAMLAAAVITVWSAVDYLVRALPALAREDARA